MLQLCIQSSSDRQSYICASVPLPPAFLSAHISFLLTINYHFCYFCFLFTLMFSSFFIGFFTPLLAFPHSLYLFANFSLYSFQCRVFLPFLYLCLAFYGQTSAVKACRGCWSRVEGVNGESKKDICNTCKIKINFINEILIHHPNLVQKWDIPFWEERSFCTNCRLLSKQTWSLLLWDQVAYLWFHPELQDGQLTCSKVCLLPSGGHWLRQGKNKTRHLLKLWNRFSPETTGRGKSWAPFWFA